MEYLYILELEGGKYYVGKTTDVKKRYEQHKSGNGSEWTRRYKPKRVLLERPLKDAHDENNVTKDYMQEYGIENVRGGAYTTSEISPEMEDTLRHEMKSNTDMCYKCGKSGHFAKYCKRKTSFKGVCGCGREFLVFEEFMSHQKMCLPRTKSGCSRCGRTSHMHERCYATSHVNGESLDSDDESDTDDDTCHRCGRSGHYANNCYAYTNSDGNYLGKPKRNYRTDWSDDDSD